MFETVEVNLKENSTASTAVKMGLVKQGRGTKGPAKARIVLSKLFLAETGFQPGDVFEFQIGRDTDAGLIRIVKNRSTGSAKLTEKKGPHGTSNFVIGLGHVRQFPDRAWAATNVVWRKIDGATIEIELPRWNPAGTALAVAAPKGKAVLKDTSWLPDVKRGGRSVTAQIMGDPHPSRGALSDQRRLELEHHADA